LRKPKKKKKKGEKTFWGEKRGKKKGRFLGEKKKKVWAFLKKNDFPLNFFPPFGGKSLGGEFIINFFFSKKFFKFFFWGAKSQKLKKG